MIISQYDLMGFLFFFLGFNGAVFVYVSGSLFGDITHFIKTRSLLNATIAIASIAAVWFAEYKLFILMNKFITISSVSLNTFNF